MESITDIKKRMMESYAKQHDITDVDEVSLEDSIGQILLSNNNLYIIGSEVVLRKDTPGTQGTGDSQILLFNAIADILKCPQEERPVGSQEWYGWLRHKPDRSLCEEAWNSVRAKEFENISDELFSFLTNGIELRLLETVFTTCVDPSIEDLMRAICDTLGRKFKVYNFKQPSQISLYLQQTKDVDQVSLIYLWGKIGDYVTGLNKTPIPFVYNEDDAMETIAEYIKQSVDNKLLQNVFFCRRAMAVGCRFDDWKFRFFWYSLRGELSRLPKGTVCYSCDNPQSDPLYRYLADIKGLHVHNNSRAFLKTMADVMESESLFEQIVSKRSENADGIFISYASEDVKAAASLFRHFTDECHFRVWMDNKSLRANERYDAAIEKAIHKCDIFVPILSSQVAEALSNGVRDRYYMQEWRYAHNEGKEIFPIIIGKYNERAGYHMAFREMCGMVKNDHNLLHVNEMDRIDEEIRKMLSRIN